MAEAVAVNVHVQFAINSFCRMFNVHREQKLQWSVLVVVASHPLANAISDAAPLLLLLILLGLCVADSAPQPVVHIVGWAVDGE